jgi:RHS repeat-associated protein
MRVVAGNPTGAVYWLHSDHLGSASLTTDASGGKFAELRYKPWGEVRWSSGAMPTDRRFTGMTTHAGLGGLVTMGVREYLPSLGRWLSADTIVPGAENPQAFNRYSFVYNSPLNFIDPSGHEPCAIYSGSKCVVRYYDPDANNAGRYAFQLVDSGTLNCKDCVTKDILSGLEKTHQDQINANFELQFGIASLIAGGRLIYKGGRWVVAEAGKALTDAGYAILVRCVANPTCSTLLLGISSQLATHESAGGHTISRHVGQTPLQLSQRLATQNVRAASTFSDLGTAQAAVNQALIANQAQITQ